MGQDWFADNIVNVRVPCSFPGAIADALALGAKAAAVTVSRAGANPHYAHEIGL
nr:hypothetical protein [Marinicella sp. W31]MDC2879919.1 hypothetical protein [Marinicella sp. W31]